MKKFLINLKEQIEKILPMKLGSFVLFVFVLYLIFLVCRVVINNYKSNASILVEQRKVENLKDEIEYLKFQINYYQTYSYKEKEARAKLGYRAPGENVLSLPIDNDEDKAADSGFIEAPIRQPNYRLWWKYFFAK